MWKPLEFYQRQQKSSQKNSREHLKNTKYIYLLHDQIGGLPSLLSGMGLLYFFGLSLKTQENKKPSEPFTNEVFYQTQHVLHLYQMFSHPPLTLQHAADLTQLEHQEGRR